MKPTTHSFPQGSPEWHAHRARCFNASEAAAMMGESKYQSREALLYEKSTGLHADVSDQQQARFNRGHAAEAAARPVIELLIDDSLYPLTLSVDVEGIGRPLSASFDGLTLGRDKVFECKLWNSDLSDQVQRGDLDPHYYWQLEQQLLVSGAEVAIFAISDEDGTNVSHMEYRAVAGRAERLLAGWRQFEADLVAYVPVARVEKVRAEPVEDFPVMVPIRMSGDVSVTHDLDGFKAKLKAHIARLPADPQTDQEFANLDDSVKRRAALEKVLKAERESALRGSPNLAKLLAAIDEVLTLSRDSRLADASKVEAQKEKMQLEIRKAAQAEFDAHVRTWNDKLPRPLLSTAMGTVKDAAIAAGMFGKKSVGGWREGAAKAVRDAKHEVDLIAERVTANFAAFAELCAGCERLFSDVDSLVFKDCEAFRAICSGRLRDEEDRKEKALAAERERIRAEEAAKLKREQDARLREIAAAATPPLVEQQETPAPPAIAAPAPVPQAANVVPMPSPAPRVAETPTLKLGTINERLGLTMTVAFVKQLGVSGSPGERAGTVLFTESEFGMVCEALVAHVRTAQAKYRAGSRVAAEAAVG